ncbi:Retrovirus-related Pol polyprotein from transposon 17.6 [Vitis vinifera]|uniref:Retrovirus-related Pol polyprotein from transposon 17.6 n=1 Tax=Vitis vinifera TaxID=29760 RepID=A0A438HAV7_VITVI|nr:Retrovirus-related Pol polyprotein from transposon 17.6 [Vitis vinifera]
MLVDSTTGHSMLSFMDGFFGYNHIMMAPKDMEKTSFITEWGTYCYKVMSFVLKNVGATYQRATTTLFHDMMHRDVEVYIDDMIVKSRDRAYHLAALERFFERIKQFKLRLNSKKCTFGVTSRKLLEYMVSERGLKVDPDKIRAILDMFVPRTEKELKGFLEPTRIREDHGEFVIASSSSASYTRSSLTPILVSLRHSLGMHKFIKWSIVAYHLASLLVSDGRVIDDDFPNEDIAVVTSLFVRLGFFDRHPTTNNIVEYEACILGLETTLELGITQMEVFGDSNLIHGDLIHVPPSELQALTSPWPFSVWGIDIIGKISPKSSSGHEFILVVIDYFTKWVEAASYVRLTSFGVVGFIISHIIYRYGVPHELISNRGVHFKADVDTLLQRYGIQHHKLSAYKPQTNEAIEAMNKNIKKILRNMVETSRDWLEKLHFAFWTYRTSFRTSTGATVPYSLVYGMEAVLPIEIEMGSLRVALKH